MESERRVQTSRARLPGAGGMQGLQKNAVRMRCWSTSKKNRFLVAGQSDVWKRYPSYFFKIKKETAKRGVRCVFFSVTYKVCVFFLLR